MIWRRRGSRVGNTCELKKHIVGSRARLKRVRLTITDTRARTRKHQGELILRGTSGGLERRQAI